MTSDAPERIWAVTEPDDISSQILGDVYAQQLPDGMVGNPVEYIRADLARPNTGFDTLVSESIEEAKQAMHKFPQPNYVISKIAEESGEVVKAAIHCAEGREKPSEVVGEMKQLIAMLYRLWIEGDQVHGLSALEGQDDG